VFDVLRARVRARTIRKLVQPRFSDDLRCTDRLEASQFGGHSADAPTLPVTIQFLIAMVAYAINERMARRVQCLQEEVRVLREMLVAKTGRPRRTGLAPRWAQSQPTCRDH
jgi:hypothetical protein